MLPNYSEGDLYSPEYLLHIKKHLEVQFAVPILKFKRRETVLLVCKHHYTSSCRFSLQFEKKFGDNDAVAYQLGKTYLAHECIDEPQVEGEVHLARAKTAIDKLKPDVTSLMAKRIHTFGIESPKKILTLLSEFYDLDESFIFFGLTNKDSQRKIKKKFDNLVAETKRDFLNQNTNWDFSYAPSTGSEEFIL